MTEPTSTPKASRSKKQERGGFFSNLAFNIVIPVIIMTRFNGEAALGPVWSIIVALAFPLAYGLWEMRATRKVNAFSVLGVVSVMLTGGISLLHLDPKYIAIKEAAIPAVIGLVVIVSQKSHRSIVRLMVFNEQVVRLDRVYRALAEHNNEALFEKRLTVVTYIVACSFFMSSALNYMLAKILVKSPAGTEEFAAELGRMTAWSYPVIVIPSMVVLLGAIWYLFAQLKKLTHLPLEELMVEGGSNDDD